MSDLSAGSVLCIHAVCKVHGLLLPAEALEDMLRCPLWALPSCQRTCKFSR